MRMGISDLISRFRTFSKATCTHISQVEPKGKFCIEGEDHEAFMDRYTELVVEGGCVSGLAEMVFNYLPVLADVDINVKYNPKAHSLDEKLYSDRMVADLVRVYVEVLRKYIKDVRPEHLYCVVLEKERPKVRHEDLKHGFHLHFPYTFVSKEDQQLFILPEIKERLRERNVFADIGVADAAETIDEGYLSGGWLMYGSRKSKTDEAYRVTRIFNERVEEISPAEAFGAFPLVDVDNQPILIDYEHMDRFYPRILSVSPMYKTQCALRQEVARVDMSLFKTQEEVAPFTHANESVPQALHKAAKLLELVADARADRYADWMRIGWILHDVGNGCREAYELWRAFSARTSRINYYSEKRCFLEWSRMELKKKFTIGSLYYYAKLDSPQKYRETIAKFSEGKVVKFLDWEHYDFAEYAHSLFKDDFVCAAVGSRPDWYEYVDNKWECTPLGIALKAKLSTHVFANLERYATEHAEMLRANGIDERIVADKEGKMVQKLRNLKKNGYKVAVMNESQELFFDKDFYRKLDQDKYLINFKNGILDLRNLEFRPGMPSDYVSLSTKYEFREFKWTDAEVAETIDALRRIFPDEKLYTYFLEYCATLLVGGNFTKTFLVHSGSGDNGKSIVARLLELSFGDYYFSLPTSVITGKRTQSASATPHYAALKGRRIVVAQEPSKGEVANSGVIKELTGNDIMYVRGLYREATQLEPLFKFNLFCNHRPQLPPDDEAIWNRVRDLRYESKFPKDQSLVPPTVEEQFRQKIFPRDEHFIEKLEQLKFPFMWMLFETLKKIRLHGREPEPEKVREATADYRKDNDVVKQFIDELVVADPDSTIYIMETYTRFTEWLRLSFANKQSIDKRDLQTELNQRWGGEKGNCAWRGYRFRTQDDDRRGGGGGGRRSNKGRGPSARDDDSDCQSESETGSFLVPEDDGDEGFVECGPDDDDGVAAKGGRRTDDDSRPRTPDHISYDDDEDASSRKASSSDDSVVVL